MRTRERQARDLARMNEAEDGVSERLRLWFDWCGSAGPLGAVCALGLYLALVATLSAPVYFTVSLMQGVGPKAAVIALAEIF